MSTTGDPTGDSDPLSVDPFNDNEDSMFLTLSWPDESAETWSDNDNLDPSPPKKMKTEESPSPSSEAVVLPPPPPPPSLYSNDSNDENQDPFGSSTEDDILMKVAECSTIEEGIDTPDHHPRINNAVPAVEALVEQSQMIEDDDVIMAKIADAMESKYDGVPLQNRFVTTIGRPHPLLIPHIYEEILGYVKSPRDIMSCRLVNTAWKEVLTDKTEALTLRNINHVVERYPYGLGFDSETDSFTTPYTPMHMPSTLHIADPCATFTKPVVSRFFKVHGSAFKRLTLDANMYCEKHWSFLNKILRMWCENLVELELIGVACVESLITYSGLNVSSRFRLRLSSLTVKCDSSGNADHHHWSTVNLVEHSQIEYNMNRLCCTRDGGLLTFLMRTSRDNLTRLSFHFNFFPIQSYISHMRIYHVDFSNLRVLELQGVSDASLHSRDFRVLRLCGLRLESLKIGPIASFTMSRNIESFLSTLSSSLVSLELLGVKPNDSSLRLGTVRFTLPDTMLSLKHLTVSDISRYRISNNMASLVNRVPSLESLDFGSELVPNRFEHHVPTYLNRLFRTTNNPAQHLGRNLKALHLTGHYGNNVRMRLLTSTLSTLFVNLTSLTVCLPDVASLNEFPASVPFSDITRLSIILPMRQIRNLSLSDTERVRASFQHTFSRVEYLTVTCVPDYRHHTRDVSRGDARVGLRMKHELCWWGSLRQLTLDGFIIHDMDSEILVTRLAESNASTVFRNCKIVKPWVLKKPPLLVHDVTLDLVNLAVLINMYFHVIL